MHPIVILSLLALATCSLAAGGYQCKNPSGKDVEWYIIYKLPKTKKNPDSSFTPNGGELAYIDSTMTKSAKGWNLLKASAFDVKGNPIANTISDLFNGKKPKDTLYVVYNDQPPAPYNGTAKGHTKGLIMFDKDGGFWLMHSVPRFPFDVLSDAYQYPDSGRENGQVFMCTSLTAEALPQVAAALRHQYPYIYEADAPAALKKNEDVKLLLEKSFIRKPATPILMQTLEGVKGTEFLSFAKHQSADDEIYANVIASQLKTDILVETWRNGAGGKIGPTCPLNGYTTTNLANVVVKFSDGQYVEFRTQEDHSKWAVSDDPEKPYFCAGSLNRMLSQYKRAGETMCISNPLVHKLFSEAIDKCDRCGGKRGETRYCKRDATRADEE